MSVPRTDRGVPSSFRGVPPTLSRPIFGLIRTKKIEPSGKICVFLPLWATPGHTKPPRGVCICTARGPVRQKEGSNP
jgi:hypothetical protein